MKGMPRKQGGMHGTPRRTPVFYVPRDASLGRNFGDARSAWGKLVRYPARRPDKLCSTQRHAQTNFAVPNAPPRQTLRYPVAGIQLARRRRQQASRLPLPCAFSPGQGQGRATGGSGEWVQRVCHAYPPASGAFPSQSTRVFTPRGVFPVLRLSRGRGVNRACLYTRFLLRSSNTFHRSFVGAKYKWSLCKQRATR